jgi:hypothetical protein
VVGVGGGWPVGAYLAAVEAWRGVLSEIEREIAKFGSMVCDSTPPICAVTRDGQSRQSTFTDPSYSEDETR